MNSRPIVLVLAQIVAWSFAGAAGAQVFIDGDVTWTAGSTQTLLENTVVRGTLTIEEGVLVEGGPDVYLAVGNSVSGPGAIIVRGTPAEPVEFDSITPANDWAGLIHVGGTLDMEHAIVHGFGRAGIQLMASGDGVVSVRDTLITRTGSNDLFSRTGVEIRLRDEHETTAEFVRCTIGPIHGLHGVPGAPGEDAPDQTGTAASGFVGAPGDDGEIGEKAGDGSSAIGAIVRAETRAVVFANTKFTGLLGGNGADGARGGHGGAGQTGGPWNLDILPAGWGGRGGDGGRGATGGNGGDAIGLAVFDSNDVTIVNCTFEGLAAGAGGHGGRGGNAGPGGRGGAGGTVPGGFLGTAGGRGGDGGDGGDAGPSGAGGEAVGVRIVHYDPPLEVYLHTAHCTFVGMTGAAGGDAGTRGSFGQPGPGGPGGAGSIQPGSDGPTGNVGSSGANGVAGDDVGPAALWCELETFGVTMDNCIVDFPPAIGTGPRLGLVSVLDNGGIPPFLKSTLIHNADVNVSGTATVTDLRTGNPMLAADLSPMPGSPAIDSGNPALVPPDAGDLDGDGDTAEPTPLDLLDRARWRGAAPDRGAVESAPPCPADLDGNGTLNFDDIDLFVNGFLAGEPAGDCDGSGILNFDDIDCFVASFLAGCP